jgi:hypothetical protein
VVGVGQVAVFRCQNLNANFIFWRVNETLVSSNIPHPDPGVTVGTIMDENDNIINRLSIVAHNQSEYNETVIVCVAASIGGGSNETIPVKLLIQGEYLLYYSNKFDVVHDQFWQIKVGACV